MRNPFKKWRESDFSPVPLGLSFEIQCRAMPCLRQPCPLPPLCGRLVLGTGTATLGVDSHRGPLAKMGPRCGLGRAGQMVEGLRSPRWCWTGSLQRPFWTRLMTPAPLYSHQPGTLAQKGLRPNTGLDPAVPSVGSGTTQGGQKGRIIRCPAEERTAQSVQVLGLSPAPLFSGFRSQAVVGVDAASPIDLDPVPLGQCRSCCFC